jgi:hypothetical protein
VILQRARRAARLTASALRSMLRKMRPTTSLAWAYCALAAGILAAAVRAGAPDPRPSAANIERATLHIATAAPHTVKIRIVDSGLDFERFVVTAHALAPTYLGSPESRTLAELGSARRVDQGVIGKLGANDLDRGGAGRREYAVPGV